MFSVSDNAKIVFYSKSISQLNGIDGLSAIIQNEKGMEPDCGNYYHSAIQNEIDLKFYTKKKII